MSKLMNRILISNTFNAVFKKYQTKSTIAAEKKKLPNKYTQGHKLIDNLLLKMNPPNN
jgi:hypothetical protein